MQPRSFPVNIFSPPVIRSYDGVNLPGISIGSPCHLADTCKISLVGGGTITIGRHFGIADHAMLLTYGGDIRIGDNVSIQIGCIVYGHFGVTIGSKVSIAAQTVIIPANHNFESIDTPIKHQGVSGQGIVICDDVWIGAGCKIMDGVTIGKGCVVGAGSVVTQSIPDSALAAGVPARVIKMRGEKPSGGQA
jgi:acetyltransferase-like isoleucine patch superfamily enzyme